MALDIRSNSDSDSDDKIFSKEGPSSKRYLPVCDPEDEFPDPKVVVIGVTGSGKSTLCNVLTGRNPDGQGDDGFPVSAKPDACTFKTNMKVCQWLGNGPKFTIVDTPGLDDPDGRVTEHIAEMADEIKKIKYVNAFLIVFNGQNPRIDRSLKSMLKIFRGMFGGRFMENTVIEFSRWSFDTRAKRMRIKEGLSEEKQAQDWNKKFRFYIASLK